MTKMSAIFAITTIFVIMQLTSSTLIPKRLTIPETPFYKQTDDATLGTMDILRLFGYPAEQYNTTTADGYVLVLHRIPSGRNSSTVVGQPKPVVFIQHGLLAASDCWLMNFPSQNLPMVLADAGYDVWLGNSRGNRYSNTNIFYSNETREFWRFSWDEMAKYDLPKMLEFVLNHTNQQDLYYIGHSQGTMIGFAEFSENQELAKKIKLFIALAPIAYVKNIRSPLINFIAPYSKDISFLLRLLGDGEFLPHDSLTNWVAKKVCEKWAIDLVCENFIFLLCGFDKYQFNTSRVDVYTDHIPAGTSTADLIHFAQGKNDGTFSHYDFGSEKDNEEHYGVSAPPPYYPSNMTVPVALMYGLNDWLSTVPDVMKLKGELPNVVLDYEVPFQSFSHLDFIMAMDAPFYLFGEILKILKQY